MKLISIFCTSVLLLLLTVTRVPAVDYSEINTVMHGWINQVRSDPMFYINELEIDVERARQTLGDSQWILDAEAGLPDAPESPILFNSANVHNRDMLDQLYLNYNSSDGRTPDMRMTESGCLAEQKGEIIAAIVLYIYVDPLEAAEAAFKYMLRDELNPDTPTGINILNPDLTEFGLSFLAGQVNLSEDTVANVYLVVADFAHAPCVTEVPEVQGLPINPFFSAESTPESQDNGTDQP